MTVQIFDHFSDQTHESVEAFLEGWGSNPWDDMNVPIYLAITDDVADVIVYLPRKEHIKHVKVTIKNAAELQQFRQTFLGIGENLYDQAARNLEAFAKGWPGRDGLILYYWEDETHDND